MSSNQRTRTPSRIEGPRLVTVLVAIVLSLVLGVVPASAASHSVEVAIVLAGDQDCSNGSDKLITKAAMDFEVEVCVTEGAQPVSGHMLTIQVTHGDGTVETLEKLTDSEGKTTFTVQPRSAGTTSVMVCDADDCYGEVILESDDPPVPPAVASYSPTGNDIGPTESISDSPLDMTDAYTGSEATPEESSRHGGADIASFSYAGNSDGAATFKVVTVGNGRALFEQGPSRWDMSAIVTTPDGGQYSIGVSNSGGQLTSWAVSSGASLDGVEVSVEWIDENTACLRATGLDVPPGSTVTIQTAAATDPEGSGFWDEATGTVTASADDPGATDEDDTGVATSGSDDTDPSTIDDGDGASSPTDAGPTGTSTSDDGGLGLLAYALITALTILIFGGLYWWYVIRPKRFMYRADRWQEPTIIHPPATSIVIDDPPPPGPCSLAYETWKESVDRLIELEAEIEARDEATDPIADLRQDNVSDARAAMDAYRRIYDECVAQNPAQEAGPTTAQSAPETTTTVEEEQDMAPGVASPTESGSVVVDKTGLSGDELDRAERLEELYTRNKGTGNLAETALDFWYFNDWHKRTFGEPWFQWTTENNLPDGVLRRDLGDIATVRKMACYEFVHLVAWASSDQPVREKWDGPEDGPTAPTGDYSLFWDFPDKVVADNLPIDGDPAAGEVVTGVARIGGNNVAGYFHTAISIGNGQVIGLGSGGLVLEDASGLLDATFNSAFYSDVFSGPYNYTDWNPPAGSLAD